MQEFQGYNLQFFLYRVSQKKLYTFEMAAE